VCRLSSNEDAFADTAAPARVSRAREQVRRRSVPLYGRGNKTNNNNDDTSDDSDSVPSLHRDPLHRRNVMMWRDHWQQPGPVNRLPAAADRNNNNNDDDVNDDDVEDRKFDSIHAIVLDRTTCCEHSCRRTSSIVDLN